MDTELTRQLTSEVERGGRAYIRNLVAAEHANLRGQFNVAKILRAVAHSQRAMAMEAARLLEAELTGPALLKTILEEISVDKDLIVPDSAESAMNTHLKQSAKVRAGLRDLVERSLTSLESNPDILESHIAQSLWGC